MHFDNHNSPPIHLYTAENNILVLIASLYTIWPDPYTKWRTNQWIWESLPVDVTTEESLHRIYCGS